MFACIEQVRFDYRGAAISGDTGRTVTSRVRAQANTRPTDAITGRFITQSTVAIANLFTSLGLVFLPQHTTSTLLA